VAVLTGGLMNQDNEVVEVPLGKGAQHVVRECLVRHDLPNAFKIKTKFAPGSYRVISREVNINGMIPRERAVAAMRDLKKSLDAKTEIKFEYQGDV
jgi:hypothetical protein